jgi:lambda repressor-like predicted transcriptional regulator
MSEYERPDYEGITDRALRGESLKALMARTGMGYQTLKSIVQRVCLYRNPDRYCDLLKQGVRRGSSFYVDVTPTLWQLRRERTAFGCPAEPESREWTWTQDVLRGASLATVARREGLGRWHLMTIIERQCRLRNAAVIKEHWLYGLTALRQHRAAFGVQEEP